MKKNQLIFLFAFMSIILSCNQSKFKYPETKKDAVEDNYFGTKVADPYRWLEDDNSSKTKAWVVAQNNLTFDYIHKIPFRQQIIDRITEIYNYERFSAPSKQGNKYFYYKNNGLQNQSVLFSQETLESEPKMLLDPNTLSTDGTVSLAVTGLSKDGKYLAYAISKGGSDWNEIFVKEVETGKILEDHIKWVKFSGISWFKDGFFYNRYPEPKENQELTSTNQYAKVYYHKVGTKQSADKMYFENNSFPDRMYSVSITEDQKYLIMSETETTSGNGLYFKDLQDENSKFVKIADGFNYDYSVIDHVNGKLLILTNNKAPKYKVIEIDVKNVVNANWKDLISEKNEVLSSCQVGGGQIVATYMKDAYSQILFYDFKGKIKGELQLPGIGTVGEFYSEKDSKTAFYSFGSFTIPSVIYKYDFETKKSEIYKSPNIKGLDFSQYETKQVFYPSKDSTIIPMFVTYKKGINLDGYNPTLLYAYGGFNISVTPSFSITRMAWLENGGIYVVANIRGGGEYGEQWHKGGTLKNKQNVFDDFIAAAEYLIAQKYTTPSRLAIEGGSNGGLLIGAVTNQRPDLFKVAIPHVGVMDMLRYQKFTIGRAWSSDYGLSEDSIMFKYLYKYSPIHNINENYEYPAVLVMTADHDDRVVPAHSFKYIATLQQKYQGENPVMIRIDVNAGHGGGKPTAKRIEEAADVWSFIYENMGINPYSKEVK